MAVPPLKMLMDPTCRALGIQGSFFAHGKHDDGGQGSEAPHSVLGWEGLRRLVKLETLFANRADEAEATLGLASHGAGCAA